MGRDDVETIQQRGSDNVESLQHTRETWNTKGFGKIEEEQEEQETKWHGVTP